MTVTNFPTKGVIGYNLQPQRYDIKVYRGDTTAFALVFSVADLTGWSAIAKIQKATAPFDPAPVAQFTVTYDLVGKKITFRIPDSSLLTDSEYRYDVQVTDAGGNKRTYIGGKILLTGDISV